MKCCLCTKEQCNYFYWHQLPDHDDNHLRALCDSCNDYYVKISYQDQRYRRNQITQKQYLKYIDLQIFK